MQNLTGMAAVKKRMPLSWVARELGINRSAVAQWKKVPAERVLDVERITGIPRHQLRPDVFGIAPAGAA